MSFSLSARSREKIEAAVRRYPQKEAALLPVLLVIQDERGFIQPEAEAWAAETLGMRPIEVREAVSFYSLLRRERGGRHNIRVCHNLSCRLAGAEDVLAGLEALLGLRAGETTSDGRFTLETVECLGRCDHAPCLMIDGQDYGPVGRDHLEGILKRLDEQEG